MPKGDTDQSGISKGDDEDEEDEEEEENEEFQPSDGSENEMETEMLDYMQVWAIENDFVLYDFAQTINYVF